MHLANLSDATSIQDWVTFRSNKLLQSDELTGQSYNISTVILHWTEYSSICLHLSTKCRFLLDFLIIFLFLNDPLLYTHCSSTDRFQVFKKYTTHYGIPNFHWENPVKSSMIVWFSGFVATQICRQPWCAPLV